MRRNSLPIIALFFALFPILFSQVRAAEVATDDDVTTQSFAFPASGAVRIVDNDQVAEMLRTHGSELLVVNFWATWCGPCVEELPYFVKVSKEFPESKVRFVGISIDDADLAESHVVPFLKEKSISYANVVYRSPGLGKSEELISSFAQNWDGEIPVTFFYDREGNQVGRFLRPVTEEELRAAVRTHVAKASDN